MKSEEPEFNVDNKLISEALLSEVIVTRTLLLQLAREVMQLRYQVQSKPLNNDKFEQLWKLWIKDAMEDADQNFSRRLAYLASKTKD